MKVYLIFAWYDLWVGAYWDGQRKRLYLLPIPCVGLRIDFADSRPTDTGTCPWCATHAKTVARLARLGRRHELFWACDDCGMEWTTAAPRDKRTWAANRKMVEQAERKDGD